MKTSQEYYDLIKKRYPSFSIKEKQTNWLWNVLSFFFPFLKQNFTIIENTLWTPSGNFWDLKEETKINILSHERCHLDQIWIGKIVPLEQEISHRRNWLGRVFGFYLPYLFWPFFIRFAYFRARAEIEAFLSEELFLPDGSVGGVDQKIDKAIYYVTSSYYLWSCSESKAREIIENIIKKGSIT